MGVFDSLSGADAVNWALVGVLALAIVENLVDGDLVWTGFLAATLVVLAVPLVAFRDAAATLPPAVTALAVLPGVTRAVGPTWLTDYAVYVGVAAVALAVVVEVSLFTEAELAAWFADALVVLTTMAAIGVWAVLQFFSDRYLGTDLLAGLHAVNWEFVRATVAGLAAAVVFEAYFEAEGGRGESVADVAEGEDG
ncbi:hypothetical protein [Halorussus sp. AFM4]|uniref:hypothetical protein n=1 Tax=Halorussus sp. AFM4 TaxID=3421651 RepID=UPI003EB9CEDB